MDNTVPSTTFINADQTLRRPNDTDVLVGRMNTLTELRLPSFAERAEMAGIWRLMHSGKVTAGTLREVLLTFYNFAAYQDKGDWLQPVRDDLALAWERLSTLVGGQKIADPPGDTHHQRDQRSLEWLRGTMHTLDLLSKSFMGSRIPELLPEQLVSYVESEAAQKWFGSPYAIGQTMEALPLNGAGAFGLQNQGVYVVDALARGVLDALTERAKTSDDSVKATALGRAKLWFMLLKGFTYSMVTSRHGRDLASAVAAYPDIAERIAIALQQGYNAAVEQANSVPEWSGTNVAASNAVRTTDLILQLRARIEEAHAAAEVLRNAQ